jgi:OOP family OmpA-OmpF porin
MNRKLLQVAIAASAIAFASSAKAEEEFKFLDDPTFYGGFGIGQSSIDTGVTAITGSASLEEEDTGFKFFGGVNLNKLISVELFYADLGQASLSGNTGDTFQSDGTTFIFTGSGSITLEGISYGLVPVIGYDVTDNIRPFAKLGVERWEAEATVQSAVSTVNLSDSGTDLVYGGGVMFKLDKNIGFRAEFERHRFDSDDVDLISVGALYTF